jgi:hypothetical protein
VAYYSAIKGWNPGFCSNMDGRGGHYIKKEGEKDTYHMFSLICGS